MVGWNWWTAWNTALTSLLFATDSIHSGDHPIPTQVALPPSIFPWRDPLFAVNTYFPISMSLLAEAPSHLRGLSFSNNSACVSKLFHRTTEKCAVLRPKFHHESYGDESNFVIIVASRVTNLAYSNEIILIVFYHWEFPDFNLFFSIYFVNLNCLKIQ